MCKFKSGEAALRGDELVIYTCEDTDSHTEIRKRHGIRESQGFGLGDDKHTPIEFVPVRGIFRPADYDFVFDAGKPKWWTEGHTAIARRTMWDRVLLQLCLVHKKLNAVGDLNLRSLTDAKGLTLPTTCGNLYHRGEWHTKTEATVAVGQQKHQ